MMDLARQVGARSVLNCNGPQSFSHMFLMLVTFLELRFKENFKSLPLRGEMHTTNGINPQTSVGLST